MNNATEQDNPLSCEYVIQLEQERKFFQNWLNISTIPYFIAEPRLAKKFNRFTQAGDIDTYSEFILYHLFAHGWSCRFVKLSEAIEFCQKKEEAALKLQEERNEKRETGA